MASLAYTGGGSIQHFAIAYRLTEADVWTELGNFSASAVNELTWTAEVANARFQNSRIELRVEAINSNGYISNSITQLEEIGKCIQQCSESMTNG